MTIQIETLTLADGSKVDAILDIEKVKRIALASEELYMGARWATVMLTVDEQVAMWEKLRVALGIPHGLSPKDSPSNSVQTAGQQESENK